MNRKELKLLISAHNATRAAFRAIEADLRHLRQELHQTAGEAERSFGRARSALGGFLGMFRGIAGLGGGASLFGGLTALLGGVSIGAGVVAFTKLGIEANVFRENTLASLQAMTKSHRVAEDLFNYLSRFADITPFDDQEVIQAGKALMTFGLDAKRYLTIAGDAAFAMKIPIEQVVHALAKLKAGSFDLAEMAPAGISREGLEQFGVRFNKGGEPVDRRRLFGAGVALLQSKFGGAMGNSATGFDATFSTMLSTARRVAREATSLLFGALKPAFTAISAELEKVLNNGKLMASLKVVFDAVGHAIGLAAAQLPKLFDWLEKVAKADGIRLLLSNVIAFGMTVGQAFAQLMGIDLGKMFDPKNVHAFFDALGFAVADAVNAIFGLGRVWEELKVIIRGLWVDAKDAVKDWADDTKRTFQGVLLGIQLGIESFTFSFLGSIVSLADALNDLVGPWNEISKKFRLPQLPTIDVDPLIKGQLDAAERVGRIGAKIGGLTKEQRAEDKRRREREDAKNQADPFRHDSFGQRIGDAFFGNNRDRSAQDEFWRRFERNRRRVQDALFPQPAAGPDVPPPHQMFGQDTRRPPTINGQPVSGGGMDPKALEALQEQVELLKVHGDMWGTIVDASRTYADTLGDHDRATRGVLTALGGQLNALNQLQAGQRQLLAAQPVWSKEWMQALWAVNATAKEITGIKNAVRDLLFDTTKLKEASGVFADIFAIGKDVGFGPEQMRMVAAQQQQLLMQTLELERARLGTLERGTAEWFKQQRTVVGTVASILKLKKELSEANGLVDRQQLRGFARARFGIHGVGAEPGALRQEGDLAREARQLLAWALNPRQVSLDAEAQRVMGGIPPHGGVANPNGAAQTAAAAATSVHNTGVANVTINGYDLATVARVAGQAAERKVTEAFQQLNNRSRDRSGG